MKASTCFEPRCSSRMTTTSKARTYGTWREGHRRRGRRTVREPLVVDAVATHQHLLGGHELLERRLTTGRSEWAASPAPLLAQRRQRLERAARRWHHVAQRGERDDASSGASPPRWVARRGRRRGRCPRALLIEHAPPLERAPPPASARAQGTAPTAPDMRSVVDALGKRALLALSQRLRCCWRRRAAPPHPVRLLVRERRRRPLALQATNARGHLSSPSGVRARPDATASSTSAARHEPSPPGRRRCGSGGRRRSLRRRTAVASLLTLALCGHLLHCQRQPRLPRADSS